MFSKKPIQPQSTRMEVDVIFTEGTRTADTLLVTSKIGRGKLFVFEVYSASRMKSYALKLFPKTNSGVKQYSKEKLMFSLNHPNVIKRVPIACENPHFYPLLTEFAKYGDFFEVVSGGFLSGEVVVRTYFHQLIEGLEYIHSQGIAHLDLKLENLMLAEDFNLKIIDFDQAQDINDKMISSAGTINYRAPEVINGVCKNLAAADVFSAGIILYTFVTKQFPFAEKEQDAMNFNTSCYSTFVHNNKLFWLGKIRRKSKKASFPKEWMELLNGMWNADPKARFTIQEIKKSKWYQGPVLDENMLKIQMKMSLERKLQ